MLHSTRQVNYIADKGQYPFFFTENLLATVEDLKIALKNTTIAIYPDATLKTNKLPTGIVCSAQKNEAILAPFILRDPGCGYLIFKLRMNKKVPSTWNYLAGNMLKDIAHSPIFKRIKTETLTRVGLNMIINQGLLGLTSDLIGTDLNKFSQKFFQANNHVITNDEEAILTDDFMQITNTLEIRKIIAIKENKILSDQGICENDYIGFIHSGSDAFPWILANRFMPRIYQYIDQYQTFTAEEISKGIFGIPRTSALGEEYATWLYAAMNYALVSRYSLYKAVKEEIESIFPCELTIVNDNVHAGLFEDQMETTGMSSYTRGAQKINTDSISLLAGQRESLAVLVIGSNPVAMNEYENFLAHGTSYHIRNDFNYEDMFNTVDKQSYLKMANETFYNSNYKIEECLPYSYNLHHSLEFFEKIQLAKTVAFLGPLINIQSERLKNLD